jgi:hypothetical protein
MTRLAAVALLALMVAACGGNAAKQQQQTADAAAAAHWRIGLTHWGATMVSAIDGISLVFSNPASVRGLQSGDKRTIARIDRLEHTLLGCTSALERIGPVPVALAASRREAQLACASLERGATLVRLGITQVQRGLGVDLLNRSSAPLGAGQEAIRRAKLDLRPTT